MLRAAEDRLDARRERNKIVAHICNRFHVMRGTIGVKDIEEDVVQVF